MLLYKLYVHSKYFKPSVGVVIKNGGGGDKKAKTEKDSYLEISAHCLETEFATVVRCRPPAG